MREKRKHSHAETARALVELSDAFTEAQRQYNTAKREKLEKVAVSQRTLYLLTVLAAPCVGLKVHDAGEGGIIIHDAETMDDA